MAYIGSSPTKVVSRQSANIFTYTAVANQVAFTGSDANGNTLACTPSDIMVHMNGLRLEESDFTATTTTVTLGSGAAAGDEVTITAFVTFETADAYTKSASDTRYVNTTGDTMTGALTVGGAVTVNNNHVNIDSGYSYQWGDSHERIEQSDGKIEFFTNNGEQMTLSGGNLGIGTTSPSSLIDIHVNSSTAYSATAEPREDAIIHNINGADGSGVNNHATLGFHVANGATSQGFLNYVRTGDNTGAFTVSQRTGSSSYAEHLKIDSAGNVTTPYKPMFRVRCANNNNVNGTVSGGVNLAGTGFYQSNTLVQAGNHFSISTGRFTAPVNGYYYLNFSNRVDNVGSGYVYFTILDNGGSVVTRNLTSVNTTYQTLHCSAVHYMSANDYVYVNYLSSSDQYVNLDSDGFFSGFLIG